MENLKNFNWGCTDEFFRKSAGDENFITHIYEKYFEVNKEDIVFDVGASVGLFTYTIIDKKPKHIFCFEPSSKLFFTLVGNTIHGPVTCINKAISSEIGVSDRIESFFSDNPSSYTITFEKVISDYNLTKIDFLKTDCEGGEYDIFNEQNLEWISSNVKKIAGEWHLSNLESKNQFRNFRNLYLNHFKNFEVMSVDGHDIKWDVWNEHFIQYYNQVMIYIDNR